MGKLKMKYFFSQSGEKLCEEINEFGKINNIKATQTHEPIIGSMLVHSAYVFYE